ncbi:MAG: acyltransferase, partial [Paracoccaceae bacterium]
MERTQEQTRPSDAPVDAPLPLDVQPYDKRKLSYANTFENPLQRITIQTIELLTARLRILRRIRKFEAQGVPFGQPLWKQALDTMGIKLLTQEEQIAR